MKYIRNVQKSDLGEISRLHQICFPDSYSSQLSKYPWFIGNLQEKFFEEYLKDCPELFLAAEIDGRIVGYCMGYYMDKDDQMRNFAKNNRLTLGLKTLLLLLLGNKPTWKKIWSIIYRSNKDEWVIVNNNYEHILNNDRGDLLSICILPEYRGSGISKDLIITFLNSLKEQGKKICLLSVLSSNDRAIRYYEKNDFFIYRLMGNSGKTFMKLL